MRGTRGWSLLGFHHFALCAEGPQLSTYHLQAAIAAAHAGARSAAETDWRMILELYTQLLEQCPSPVVALNRIVAVAKVNGTEQALSELNALANEDSLRNYYLLPAVEGSLLLEAGNHPAAAESFHRALATPVLGAGETLPRAETGTMHRQFADRTPRKSLSGSALRVIDSRPREFALVGPWVPSSQADFDGASFGNTTSRPRDRKFV